MQKPQQSQIKPPSNLINLSARFDPSPRNEDISFMNLQNQNIYSRDHPAQISTTEEGHSSIIANTKKDSLFRNSLDEYSAQVKLMPSASATGFKRDSDLSTPFENTNGENRNFVKKE